MTGRPVAACACAPPWPSLVVPTEAGDVIVKPAATPGPLACLYHAYCAHCGAVYPGPFRIPPAPQRPAAQPPPGQAA
jgi:hypothetical protein